MSDLRHSLRAYMKRKHGPTADGAMYLLSDDDRIALVAAYGAPMLALLRAEAPSTTLDGALAHVLKQAVDALTATFQAQRTIVTAILRGVDGGSLRERELQNMEAQIEFFRANEEVLSAMGAGGLMKLAEHAIEAVKKTSVVPEALAATTAPSSAES